MIQWPNRFIAFASILALVSASAAPVASAQSVTTPAQRLNENQAAPIVVIDAFLAAQGTGDADAAAGFFETEASITDSSGRSAFGTNAVRHLIESLNGWEAGPRYATRDEVIWAENLPIWRLPAAPTDLDLLLEQEVPHYGYAQVMCGVVTDGKIHTLSVLGLDSERSCELALNASTADLN